jgi:hypothetical protein
LETVRGNHLFGESSAAASTLTRDSHGEILISVNFPNETLSDCSKCCRTECIIQIIDSFLCIPMALPKPSPPSGSIPTRAVWGIESFDALMQHAIDQSQLQ